MSISAKDYQPRRTNCLRALPALVAGLTIGLAMFGAVTPALAQDKKPNILFIMGDDIGWMQVVSYQEIWDLARRPTLIASATRAPSS